MSFLRRLPCVLILVLIWGLLKAVGLDLPINHWLSIVLILLGLVAMIPEFIKATVMSASSMLTELLVAIVSWSIWLVAITLIVKGENGTNILDWAVGIFAFIDLVVSTCFTMQMALRQVNVKGM